MKLIAKADDFGFTEAISHGIIKAYTDGIVRSTGIMINMPSAKHSVDLIKDYPGLCLGLHVNLVIGKPVCNPKDVPSLVEDNGEFHSSKVSREKIAKGIDPVPVYEEGYKEVEAQILQFYHMTGKMPEYLEGHAIRSQTLNQIYHDLAVKYNLVHVSHVPEMSVNISNYPLRGESIYDWYAQATLEPYHYFTDDIGKIKEKEYCLLVMHPGYVDDDITHMSSFTMVRTKDLAALTHSETKKWIEDNGIELISHRDIKKW